MVIGRDDLWKAFELIESEEALEEIGRELGATVAKRLFAVYNVEPGWDTVLDALDQTYGRVCGWFDLKHFHIRDTHRLIFVHDAGHRWTVYLKGYLTGMIGSLLDVEPKVVTATDKILDLTA